MENSQLRSRYGPQACLFLACWVVYIRFLNNYQKINMHPFIRLTLFFIALVLAAAGLHYLIAETLLPGSNSVLILKMYAIIGIMTLMILQVGYFVKYKSPTFVGFAFMGGMIAKMAVVLALVVVNEQIKLNVMHLISAYFVVLLLEVLIFIRLIKIELKKF